jgi:TatD DNase family protein
VKLIDTHSHLFSSEFEHDRDLAVDRAKRAGVQAIILPNIDSSSIDAVIKTSQKYSDICYPCMGLHPTSVKDDFCNELMEVEKTFSQHSFVAVGEIGIDLYWDKTHIEQQLEAFRYQLKMAKKMNLPVIIHTRNAFDEVLSIVDQENDSTLSGVFHSFSGDLNHYQHITSYGGFYIGIGGVVTYKNGGLDKVVKHVNPQHILLETDSPYLTPVPFRGKRNESSYITFVAEAVSELIGLKPEELSEITTNNAKRLFSI